MPGPARSGSSPPRGAHQAPPGGHAGVGPHRPEVGLTGPARLAGGHGHGPHAGPPEGAGPAVAGEPGGPLVRAADGWASIREATSVWLARTPVVAADLAAQRGDGVDRGTARPCAATTRRPPGRGSARRRAPWPRRPPRWRPGAAWSSPGWCRRRCPPASGPGRARRAPVGAAGSNQRVQHTATGARARPAAASSRRSGRVAVVVVEEGEPAPGGFGHAGVAGRGRSAGGRAAHHPDPRIRRVDHLAAAVVHDQALPVGPGLGQHRGHRLGQQVGSAEGGDDDREGRVVRHGVGHRAVGGRWYPWVGAHSLPDPEPGRQRWCRTGGGRAWPARSPSAACSSRWSPSPQGPARPAAMAGVGSGRPGSGGRRRGDRAGARPIGSAVGRAQLTNSVRALVARRRPDLVHTTLFDADLVGRVGWSRGSDAGGVAAWSTWPTAPSSGPTRRWSPGSSRRRAGPTGCSALGVRRFHALSPHVAEVMGPRLGIPAARIDVIPRGRDAAALGAAHRGAPGPGPRRAGGRTRRGSWWWPRPATSTRRASTCWCGPGRPSGRPTRGPGWSSPVGAATRSATTRGAGRVVGPGGRHHLVGAARRRRPTCWWRPTCSWCRRAGRASAPSWWRPWPWGPRVVASDVGPVPVGGGHGLGPAGGARRSRGAGPRGGRGPGPGTGRARAAGPRAARERFAADLQPRRGGRRHRRVLPPGPAVSAVADGPVCHHGSTPTPTRVTASGPPMTRTHAPDHARADALI